jgi:hypothetical protein
LSAAQFDQPGFTVECTIFQSALWGTPLLFPGGYLYLRRPAGEQYVMVPFGQARVSGTPERFEIEVRGRVTAPITLRATGRDYGDLGDRIINTLVGDLAIYERGTLLARASGTAALERRYPDGVIPNIKG